jgi:hypothetical protein
MRLSAPPNRCATTTAPERPLRTPTLGHEFVTAATRAVHTREAVGQDAAVEVAAQFAPDETRETRAGFLFGAHQEGGEVLLQRAVERAGLGLLPLANRP